MSSKGTIAFRVLTADGAHPVTLSPDSTIADLKRVLENGPLARDSAGMTMRIIFSGRTLVNDATLSSCGVTDGSTVHCALSGLSVTVEAGRASATSRLRGFSRLRQLGLDEEEVTAIRTHFFSQVYAIEQEFPRVPGEDEPDRTARIEDGWMQRQTRNSEFALNLRPIAALARQRRVSVGGAVQGPEPDTLQDIPCLNEREGEEDFGLAGGADSNNLTEFIMGCLMGFFLGFLVMIWMCSNTLSRAQKRGIVLGMAFNILLTLSRQSAERAG